MVNALRSLDRKALRNVWALRGQLLAIVLIMTAGISTFIMSLSTIDSLELTRDRYYREYRFADAFSSLTRAPERLAEQVQSLDGVASVETRIVSFVTVRVPGYDEPVKGQLVSIPDEAAPSLNDYVVIEGSSPAVASPDGVMISDQFAEAHALAPGDTIRAVIEGSLTDLRITGIAMSPEFVAQIEPGTLFPAPERFGIIWMRKGPLAAATDLEGAFNDLALGLAPGASLPDLTDRLDDLLEQYGSLGAFGRADQPSNLFLEEELKQLRNTATLIPSIFLAVAAFLLNIVISRLVATQRTQIALLKAFGYRNTWIGVHFLKIVLVIVVTGAAAGIALGVWTGRGLGDLYLQFYRFPYLEYTLRPDVLAVALSASIGAALLGTAFAIWRAVRVPPAVAMQPEPPSVYRPSIVERIGLGRTLAQPTRMILRQIQRRPVKSLLTMFGVTTAAAILVLGRFSSDSVDYIIRVQFEDAQREDIAVTFTDPISPGAEYEVLSMDGVTRAQPFMAAPATLRAGHRSYRTSIQGVPPSPSLHRILDRNQNPIQTPTGGLMLTDHLADYLDLELGDAVTVEFMTGRRRTLDLPVSALSEEFLGVSAYMAMDDLNHALMEGHRIGGLYLAVDEGARRSVVRTLGDHPRVAGVGAQQDAIRAFMDSSADMLLTFTYIITLLAGLIAFGVVYNSARIALSERRRDLASLRVLGFTRGEISYILLGELGLLTLLGIPAGLWLGWMMSGFVAEAINTDLYRIPLVTSNQTFALAATTVLAASLLSGLVIRRRLNRLDLIEVLKTRE